MSGEPPQATGRGALVVEILKATYLPLLFGLLCFGALILIWVTDVSLPWRSAALVVMTVCIAGPFAIAYCTLAAYVADMKRRIPVLLVDEDHEEIGQVQVAPASFGDLEVDGELATRRSKAGTVYVAEEQRVEQRETVDPETGEQTVRPQRVLEGTWEGEVSSLAFAESKNVLKEQRERLVPLARDALKVRAATDEKVLDGVVSSAHGMLLGAERDEFFADDADPLGFDLEVQTDDVDDLLDDNPEPTSEPELEADAASIEEPTDAISPEAQADE